MTIPASAGAPQSYGGLAAYFDRPIWRDPERAKRVAELLLDPRWPWIPWWAAFSGVDKKQDLPAVRVGGKTGAERLLHAFLSPELSRLAMKRSVRDVNVSGVSLGLGRLEEESWGYEAPLKMWIICRTNDLPADKSVDSWLGLAHDLIATVGASNATLGIWPTYEMAVGDTYLTRIIVDTPQRDQDLGLPDNFAAQIDLLQRWKKFLGRTYARHPRWGTYLNAAHVAAIGGEERIRAEVEPAQIKAVGELTYIQLTESVETALTPLAGERRRRLEALMAPIILGAGRE